MTMDRIKLALDVGRTGVWFYDPAAASFIGDTGVAVLWGRQHEEQLNSSAFTAGLHRDDAVRVDAELRQAASGSSPERFLIEFRIVAPPGEERWITLEGRQFSPHGAERGVELLGLAYDTTARRERDKHVHLLMREVTHRSKNLLAIIQAMARQTVKDNLSAAEFEQRFSARLRGLAVSHDLLAARDWHGAAVADLVRWQLGPLVEQAGGQLALTGPDLFLKPEAAQNLGLAFNELATNAVRYGALSSSSGRISVTWSLDAADVTPRRFHIQWLETGGPAVTAPNRQGFGHKVVERLAARALDGVVSLTFAASGLQWSMAIPSSFVVEHDAVPPPVS